MKSLRRYRKITGILVFSLCLIHLQGSVTTSIAAGKVAAAAGAKSGIAVTEGISHGTITATIIGIALIAGIIAASGTDAKLVTITGKSVAGEFMDAVDATTEADVSKLIQALTGAGDLQNIDLWVQSLDADTLGEWQAALSAAITLSDVTEVLNTLTADGLLKGMLLKGVSTDFSTTAAWDLYSLMYDTLNSDVVKSNIGAVAFSDLLRSLGDNNNVNGLKALVDFLANLTVAELGTTKNLLSAIAKDPANEIERLLTVLHPGFTPTVTTVIHGGGIYTTTIHLMKK